MSRNHLKWRDHRIEAIRQINLALTEEEIPDAVIMAILGIGMIKAMEEAELKMETSKELDCNSPFKQPYCLLGGNKYM